MENNMNAELEAELKAAGNINDVMAALEKRNISISKEELLEAVTGTSNGEMSEDALDHVSGGCIMCWLSYIGYRIGGASREEAKALAKTTYHGDNY